MRESFLRPSFLLYVLPVCSCAFAVGLALILIKRLNLPRGFTHAAFPSISRRHLLIPQRAQFSHPAKASGMMPRCRTRTLAHEGVHKPDG